MSEDTRPNRRMFLLGIAGLVVSVAAWQFPRGATSDGQIQSPPAASSTSLTSGAQTATAKSSPDDSLTATAEPTTATPPATSPVWLGQGDLADVSDNSDWATLSGGSVSDYPWAWDPQPLGRMGGKAFEWALIVPGTHTNEYALGSRYSKFTGTFGVDDVAAADAEVDIVVRCDGRELKRGTATHQKTVALEVAISGCFRLELTTVSQRPDEFQPGFLATPRVE